ncbi:MAG TPA: urea carboxylase-associated family protein [Rhodothermales bacterium]|nr:urea carboxylase-associated family protein [Rhodothermales bacterium]
MSDSPSHTLVIPLTEQQLELLDEVKSEVSVDTMHELMVLALEAFVVQEQHHLMRRRYQPSTLQVVASGVDSGTDLASPREVIRLIPVSGKAMLVRAGETLRIRQLEGEQCVDFNAFNAADYDERMSVGHSRRQGFRLVAGDVLLSNRNRPLLYISHMPVTCVTDLLAARCNGAMFEKKFGFTKTPHTNCQDTLAESIREFGLTSDHVHDSFNIWMNTNWDSSGNWWVEWNSAEQADYVDFIACEDTICVPVTCGSGDVHPTSNFFLRPIEVEVYSATVTSIDSASKVREAHYSSRGGLRTGGDPDESRAMVVKDGYEANFLRYPLRIVDFQVRDLTPSVVNRLNALIENGWARDLGDAARKALMLWYLRNAGRNNSSVGGRFRW